MTGLDWPGLLRLGLHELRLKPAEFWGLTPGELMLIAGLDPSAARVMGRAHLMALTAQFPDKETKNGG